jgi:hypothetical protein
MMLTTSRNDGAFRLADAGRSMSRQSLTGRHLLHALVATALIVLSGCGTGGPSGSHSPSEPFVGYWRYLVDSTWPSYLEVLQGPDGYQVSWNGQVPFSVALVGGRLVLQRPINTSTATRVGYELAWEDGQCAFYTNDMGPPIHRQVLKRLDESTYVNAVTRVADRWTKESCQTLASGVLTWIEKRGQGPPSPADMRAGSPFCRWLQKLADSWQWPSNAFTGNPMRISDQRGDFSYVVHDQKWTMRGNLSDGSDFNARLWK